MTRGTAYGWEAGIPARFPAGKTLDDYDVERGRVTGEVIAHLGSLNFVEAAENLVFLGPPGSGKTHLAIGICIRASEAGYGVAFATATEWAERLGLAHAQGRLHDELRWLGHYPLLVIDEIGYFSFKAEPASLLFQLVSSRCERGSLIVTSNKPFSRWPELFGDPIIATGIRDRLLHHAEVVTLERSVGLDDRGPDGLPVDDNPLAPEGVA